MSAPRRGRESSGPGSPTTDNIVVVTNDRSEVFQRSVIRGVEGVTRGHGLGLTVVELADPPSDDAARVLAAGGSGVLILANVLSDGGLVQLRASGIPMTLVSHRPGTIDLPTVMHDNAQGMGLLVRHLVEDLGRTRLAFIRGDAAQTDALEREHAFRRELLRYDLSVPEERFLRGDFVPQRAGAALGALVPQAPELDGVLASDYLMAIEAKHTLEQLSRGAANDVAVVGFGDGPEAEAAGITTVAADVVELGRRGARQLLDQLEHGPIRGLTLLSTELVERGRKRSR